MRKKNTWETQYLSLKQEYWGPVLKSGLENGLISKHQTGQAKPKRALWVPPPPGRATEVMAAETGFRDMKCNLVPVQEVERYRLDIVELTSTQQGTLRLSGEWGPRMYSSLGLPWWVVVGFLIIWFLYFKVVYIRELNHKFEHRKSRRFV